MKHYQKLGLIGLLSALLIVFGCSSNSSAPASSEGAAAPVESAAAGTAAGEKLATELKYPLAQTIPTLDPHLSLGGSNSTIAVNIYEGLFAFNSKYEPVPMLAESYELSEDGKVYTFHLRKGVKFHNGKEMKAEDVAASLNRWKNTAPRAKSSFSDREFEVKDDYTIVLSSDVPRNDTLAQLSHVLNFAAIMPKEVVDAAGPDGVTEYIGTGPFKFVDYKTDQYVHVQKFADYQPVDAPADGFSGKKEALVNDLYFTLATDNATRFSSFLAKDFNNVDVSLDNLPQVESDPDVEIIKNLSTDFNLIFNKKAPLFSQLKYRQAVASVLDVDQVLLGIVSTPELYRLNPSYMYKENTKWYSEAGSEAYNQKNPDKAKQLLKEAGYNGEEVTLLTTKDTGTFYNATLMVQAQLEQIGIKTKIDISDYATMLTKRADPNGWDIYVGPFLVPSTPSQLLYLNPTYGFADDAKLAELLEASTSAIGDDAIKAANDALQAYEWEYLAAIKIGDIYNYNAIRKNLVGLTFLSNIPNLANTKLVE
ncbi:peptide/nickel transport system substrate-binding protein [Paenibacillus algorifonticola]|uniref:Peptide/nickel transport system substrate-binding protein n=1 Tax=Paenibacillus algorifonticola TaxID=684063 RepID=A0A1I2GP83_9BACL|nr:ABC transporter substrate-binding protein [Paenibacillus algorifonticola]SFF18819.1 peptide/nickel transport system substrate-binding protein [Paenibacillus algorifonticola]